MPGKADVGIWRWGAGEAGEELCEARRKLTGRTGGESEEKPERTAPVGAKIALRRHDESARRTASEKTR